MLSLPREHGAWAMLLVPFLTGAMVGAVTAPPDWWLLAAGLSGTLLLFTARPPLLLLFKRRTRSGGFGEGARRLAINVLVPAMAAAVLYLWLILCHDLGKMLILAAVGLPLFAIHLAFVDRRRERSAAAEMVGVALLTLTAPLAYGIATGGLDAVAWWLWLLNGLYFSTSIFYVKMRMTASRLRENRPGWRRKLVPARNTMAYSALAAALLAVAAGSGRIPAAAPAAYLPLLVYIIIRIVTLGTEMRIKQEGIWQTVLSAAFGIILVMAYSP
ncbi:hypothetical protein BMS3Abin01_00709 [bacterium BMS3Abin01]|nr:hypothetical protein BMS3Abin01_00709 [bacterium BMS3Abin01]